MNPSLSLLCTIFLMGLALSISNANNLVVGDWCVAKPGALDSKLKQYLDNACSSGASRSTSLDCSLLLPGAACFEPNTIRNHASYALNIFYKAKGECDSDLGTIVNNNPSTRTCNYP